MLQKRTVEFSTPGTRLSVAHRQLVVERPGAATINLPIEDLGVVVVDDVRATYTQAVLLELLAAGATLLVSGRDHLPAGMMLPLDAHHVITERHRAQVETGSVARKRIWQALVAAKISQQAAVLRTFSGTDGGLAAMARRVGSGDPENLEAQAAQRYWPMLLGRNFRRDRTSDGTNALLNYGYAILRGAVARRIVASGLIPSLGVFHKNRSNPFCLADDLLEPFRPLVDWRVKLLLDEFDGEAPSLEERATKAALLSLFNETVMVQGRRNPLLVAIQLAAASLARALTGPERTLTLPSGLPVSPDLLDGDGLG